MSDAIRIAVVDDSPLVRQSMRELFEGEPGFQVIWAAQDPLAAEKRMELERPDVLILDVEMPRMDGLAYLKALMKSNPLPVIICSGHTAKGGTKALEALESGAVDIIEKPSLATKQFFEESKLTIFEYVRAAAQTKSAVRGKTPASPPQQELPFPARPKLSADVILAAGREHLPAGQRQRIIVAGASTGGTEALRVFLQGMPAASPGIVIVQHMPQGFTKAFAERLDGLCALHVKEAEDKDEVVPGVALIAPGNKHTLLRRDGSRYFVEVRDGPLVSRHRPSVDVLFRSAARYAGPNAVGVIMTGMGDDGASGMKEMKDAGAFTLAQDEASCVVYGMPMEAVKRGAVDSILDLNLLADAALKAAAAQQLSGGVV